MNNATLALIWLIACSAFAKPIRLKTQLQDSYPKYYYSGIEDQRVIQGLCVDIIEALKKEDPELDIQYPPYFVPFKRIQRNLTKTTESGIDIFLGMAQDEGRSSDIQFLEPPLYQVNHKIAVRKGDPVVIQSFDDLRALKGDKRILTNFGTATDKFLREQADLDIDADGKDISKNLRKLVDGSKGRFVYFHDIALVSTIKRDFLQNKVRVLPATFRSYHHYLVVNKELDPEIVQRLTTALQKLQSKGILDRIIARYNSLEESASD